MENQIQNENYSVLMSVYNKENPKFLEEAILSMLNQTYVTNDFVLVCDGPLTKELYDVIDKYKYKINVIQLEKNMGLGQALNIGLEKCINSLVARMDTDDISKPDRCQKQLNEFSKDKDLEVVSGCVEEFTQVIGDMKSKKRLPNSHDDVVKFSKKRNPVNHPAVMFRKESVIRAGGYSERFNLFEDYYLWVRMLMNQSKIVNLRDTLLYMRTPLDLYKRRGGLKYAKNLMRFHTWMLKEKWIGISEYITSSIPHAIVCILPTFIRKQIYKLLRG